MLPLHLPQAPSVREMQLNGKFYLTRSIFIFNYQGYIFTFSCHLHIKTCFMVALSPPKGPFIESDAADGEFLPHVKILYSTLKYYLYIQTCLMTPVQASLERKMQLKGKILGYMMFTYNYYLHDQNYISGSIFIFNYLLHGNDC